MAHRKAAQQHELAACAHRTGAEHNEKATKGDHGMPKGLEYFPSSGRFASPALPF